MNIDVTADAQSLATDESAPARAEDIVRQHQALCRLGLPLQPGEGSWHRDIGSAALGIEPSPAVPGRPHGRLLRLLLLYVFDTALRQDSAVVEIGDGPEALATRMGLATDADSLAALAGQVERVLTARISISLDGAAPLGVFDARGRPRGAAPEWRPSLRLNARFLAALAEGAVALDRRVVAALSGNALALDAYMWLAGLQANPPPEEGHPGALWPDLFGRFGDVGQTEESFRSAFEEGLRLVTAACPSVVVVAGEQGVQLRPPSAEPPPMPRHPAPRPAPGAVAVPTPERRAPEPKPADAKAAEPKSPEPKQPEARPPEPPARAAAPEPAAEPPEPRAPRQSVSLKSHMTGLSQVVWLQRANGRDTQIIEVTPGGRYDPDTVTVLALEPLVVQISGGLYDREFERVSAWAMTNRDLIDDFWEGKIAGFDEVASRVKKVPAQTWR